MSIVPRFGINLLINLRGGFVSLYEISKTEYTKRLLVLITLNATNQLATAFITKTQIYNLIISLNKIIREFINFFLHKLMYLEKQMILYFFQQYF